MIVKLLTTMAGVKGIFYPGGIIDISEAEAEELVSAGYALHVAPLAETQAFDNSENTMMPKARNKKRSKE